MSRKTPLVKTLDRPLIAVRITIALAALLMLIAIKHVIGVSWIIYIPVLSILAALGYGFNAYRKWRAPRSPLPHRIAHTTVIPPMALPRQVPAAQANPEESIVFERHWKMVVIEAVPRIVLLLGVGYLILAYGRYMFSQVQLGVLVISIILLMVYAVRRAIFICRHSRLRIEGNRLIVEAPRSIRFNLLGGALDLHIDDISVVELGKPTLLELLVFKTVQTVTIDTAARKDGQAHNVRHIVGAAQVGKAIFDRKHELRTRSI